MISIFLLCFLALCGCTADSQSPCTSQIFALDTVIDITAYGDNGQKAISAASKEIYRLEKLFSVTNENSEIYMLNHSGGKEVTLSEETYSLLKTAKEINAATMGNFDITIYPVLTLWGFTEEEYRVPSDTEITDALACTGIENIVLSENNTVVLLNNAQVDLGGIAKGYIADKAAQAMTDSGCTAGLLSLGGNIRTVGKKPSAELWSIGIQSPESKGYFATVSTEECSVITSGAYQRNFTENGVTYHHIIDPQTGKPSTSEAVSVTIIGKDGAVCDALSTAVYISGVDYAENLYKTMDFEYIILTSDKKVYVSTGIKDVFTLAENTDLEVIYK